MRLKCAKVKYEKYGTLSIYEWSFTLFQGKGRLQTTMAVIDAARRISEAGTQLDKLARQIADQCPESSTKKDLIAYLQRIALYCHQLNITSKVCYKTTWTGLPTLLTCPSIIRCH